MYIEIFIIRLSPLKASATLGIALIVSYVQVRHATIQANGTLANVDQTESMFKFRGGSLIFLKRIKNGHKSSLNDQFWPERSNFGDFDRTPATFKCRLFWSITLFDEHDSIFRVCWSVQWDYICINLVLFGNSSCNFLFFIFCNFVSTWNAS